MYIVTRFGFDTCLYRIRIGVIGHGASVFKGVINLHERIRHGTTLFFAILLAYWRSIGYIPWIINLFALGVACSDFPLALKHIHAAKHPCEYENLWSVPVSSICVTEDWLCDLSDFN